MKKVLILVFVLSSAAVATAQVQVALGIKAGANISKFDGENTDDNIAGFHGGAFALFKVAKFGIQPEFLFSQQGSKFSDLNYDLKTSYVTIPVMVKFYLIGGLNLQAGPQFGFLTKAELEGQNVEDSFKNSDVSANVGLGWDLPFGLTVDARYNIGLSGVGDGDGLIQADTKSRIIQLSVGYKIFKFGK